MRLGLRLPCLLALALAGCLAPRPSAAQAIAQTRHWYGQGVAPIYEGWDRNADGSYNMWFGYMNRNFEEVLDVAVGPDNRFEPGTADRGQPTFFDTRRHKDVFRVLVPKEFPENAKLTWSLTVRAKTETVAGTLNRVWQIDRQRTTRGGNSENINSNTPPAVTVHPLSHTLAGGALATFTVSATDDGLPKRRTEGVERPAGMTVEWTKYRGPGAVTFTPPRQPLANGTGATTAAFSAPGEYVLIAVVDDGSGESAGNFGYHCCWTNVQVTLTVK